MNPLENPYSPGAGAPPPELAGRDALLQKSSLALQRIALGRFERSFILIGLRGVGKTVLLNRMRQEAEAKQLITVRIEAVEERSLPSLLVPGLKSAILKLSRGQAAADIPRRALVALSKFVSALKFRYQDIEVGLDFHFDTEPFSSLDLDDSLVELFHTIGTIAKEKETAVILCVDELQMLDEKQLASLIMALHLVAQDALPITMIAAGLPQLLGKMGKAKTYAERLFEYHNIGSLDFESATQALVLPAERLGVEYSEAALVEIFERTQGYAYFLQEWGKNIWDIAESSPFTKIDAELASQYALADLDASFFRVRFDQLTTMQKQYLFAMAKLGDQSIPSGEIAKAMQRDVRNVAPIRSQLIHKGLIYSPSHGMTAYTVPLFDYFMKRMMDVTDEY